MRSKQIIKEKKRVPWAPMTRPIGCYYYFKSRDSISFVRKCMNLQARKLNLNKRHCSFSFTSTTHDRKIRPFSLVSLSLSLFSRGEKVSDFLTQYLGLSPAKNLYGYAERNTCWELEKLALLCLIFSYQDW
jgi:hypothetical protein